MEKRCTNKNENPTPIQTSLDKELDAALKEFHRRYGNDFQAFLREVRESLQEERKLNSESVEFYQI
jgi:hypothetical protein